MVTLSACIDRVSLFTGGMAFVTSVLGVIACPLESVAIQAAFRYLSLATVVFVVLSLAWHGYRETLPQAFRMKYGVGVFVIVWLYLHLLWEYQDYGKIREASALTVMRNDAKYIALAVHNIHDERRRLPQDMRDAGGQPLLSWRVSVLPYVDQAPLFNQFDQNQAWDSPRNQPFLAKRPYVYESVLFPQAPSNTPWQGFVGPGTAFEAVQGGLRLDRDFPDGTSNTILIVEAKEHVPWSAPMDIPYGAGIPLPALGEPYPRKSDWPFCCRIPGDPRFIVAMVDGTVRVMSPGITEARMRSLIERNDGGPKDFD
jgi:hypothetical protein